MNVDLIRRLAGEARENVLYKGDRPRLRWWYVHRLLLHAAKVADEANALSPAGEDE